MPANTDVREQLRHFQHELVAAEGEAQRASQRVENLRQVVQGLKGLLAAGEPERTPPLFGSLEPAGKIEPPGEPPHETAEEPLRGRDAVRRVLIDSRRAWKIPDLAAEIQKCGWMPDVASPRDATAASVQRLVRDGEAERVGYGTYRYRLDKLPPPQEDPDRNAPREGDPD